ncbi:hypothetical protein BN948_01801 [Hydrogenophaga intermedia]|uniref:DUF2303 family protein n=1 Tax=Hydrogenophaga intermedia TaxID=65786 RepID=A0A1L1PHY8_HYDIT|nr:DUF2303 family protein [Hydrogenophaga intermedia]CDN87379.1 hypothetical protein BN948_01801 [Hydrogenophaga intermedia]
MSTEAPQRPDTSSAATNVPELFAEIEAGMFDRALSTALSQVAGGVTTHEKKGKVTLELNFEHIKGTSQVRVAHTIKYSKPTRVGKSSEEMAGAVVLHVGRFGRLTIGQPSLFDESRQQQAMVEFFEDWIDYCKFMSEEYLALDPRHAIAALRHLTIETARKAESKVGNLSAEASAFERVKADSPDMIPVFIEFTTVPYLHLQSHTFKLRLAIHTPNDKAPQIGLQIRNLEEKKQEMAEEFVELARSCLRFEAPQLPVMVGSYARAS